MAKLMTGAPVAKEINERAAALCRALSEKGITPSLVIVRTGNAEDALAYERSAVRCCTRLGITVRTVALDDEVSRGEFLSVIGRLNRDSAVHGVLLLAPLPAGLDAQEIGLVLDPAKDVDGITPLSQSGVFSGSGSGFAPCTAQACMELLDYYGVPLSGKKAAVVGRSIRVGRPLSMLLLARDATVTLCHSHTPELHAILSGADIIVAAAGAPRSVTAEAFREGQAVIDVGFYVDSEGHYSGNTDIGAAMGVADYATPVPGGIGAVTTALLALHTAEAAQKAGR